MSRVLAVGLLAVSQAVTVAGQSSTEEIQEQADAAVLAAASESTPGLAAAIVRQGTVVWRRYLGVADLDHAIAIEPRSRFYLGSLTKPLIAATVISLADDARISMDDTLDLWFPELPSWAERVSVRQLLSMTSGVRDYLKLRDLAGEPKDGAFDNDTALEILGRQRGLAFDPGSRYKYSNSNYVLLAEIIGRVTGEAVEDVVGERVLAPLGMEGALLESDHTQVVADRVISYRQGDDGAWHRYLKNFSSLGDGGGWATLDDLLALDRWIASGDGPGAGVLATMLEPAELNDGSRGDYAAGLLVRDWRGLPAVEHGGFMLGFQHLYLRLPVVDVGVVLLTNNREIDVFALRDRLLEIALGDDVPAVVEEETATVEDEQGSDGAETPLPTAVADCYWNDEAPVGIEISERDGQFFMRPTSFRELPLERTGERLFAVAGMQIRLLVDADNAVESFELLSDDFGSLPFVRAPVGRCQSVH